MSKLFENENSKLIRTSNTYEVTDPQTDKGYNVVSTWSEAHCCEDWTAEYCDGTPIEDGELENRLIDLVTNN